MLCDDLEGGVGRQEGGSEEGYMYTYKLIHFVVKQKLI